MTSTTDCSAQIRQLNDLLTAADAVVIGAGAGLSTSAGFTYSGQRFLKYFGDFADKFGIRDIYSGGFYPFPDMETYWAWWSRHIWLNRYVKAPKPVYDQLLELVREKDYFVLTTNVDHQFQLAGFDKQRLFYTQGDYGLMQCIRPCHKKTYDNYNIVLQMIRAQGFSIREDGKLIMPAGKVPETRVPSELVPHCPVCGSSMVMNLRADETFVEDEGWRQAAARYAGFLQSRKSCKTLFLELGVGGNTPGIIKYPFWRMTAADPDTNYACINFGEAGAPKEIVSRSVCISADIGDVLRIL